MKINIEFEKQCQSMKITLQLDLFFTYFNYCLFKIFLQISRCYLKFEMDKQRLSIFSLLIRFAFFLISMNNVNLFTQSQNQGITFGLGFIPDLHIQALHMSLSSETFVLGWDESVSEHAGMCTLMIYRQQKQVVWIR